jgi:hypothetical protein
MRRLKPIACARAAPPETRLEHTYKWLKLLLGEDVQKDNNKINNNDHDDDQSDWDENEDHEDNDSDCGSDEDLGDIEGEDYKLYGSGEEE